MTVATTPPLVRPLSIAADHDRRNGAEQIRQSAQHRRRDQIAGQHERGAGIHQTGDRIGENAVGFQRHADDVSGRRIDAHRDEAAPDGRRQNNTVTPATKISIRPRSARKGNCR
jgi:hypothetical protein